MPRIQKVRTKNASGTGLSRKCFSVFYITNTQLYFKYMFLSIWQKRPHYKQILATFNLAWKYKNNATVENNYQSLVNNKIVAKTELEVSPSDCSWGKTEIYLSPDL